jgi:hypothetical protein
VGLLCLALEIASWAAPAHKDKNLHIYFVDVEGGQATLFVTPAGQSLLIDTGWPGNDGRDADRIVAAARKAGLNKIDYVRYPFSPGPCRRSFPVGRAYSSTFIDHRENRENDAGTIRNWRAYPALLATGKYKHRARPGNSCPSKEYERLSSVPTGTDQNRCPARDRENRTARVLNHIRQTRRRTCTPWAS